MLSLYQKFALHTEGRSNLKVLRSSVPLQVVACNFEERIFVMGLDVSILGVFFWGGQICITYTMNLLITPHLLGD